VKGRRRSSERQRTRFEKLPLVKQRKNARREMSNTSEEGWAAMGPGWRPRMPAKGRGWLKHPRGADNDEGVPD